MTFSEGKATSDITGDSDLGMPNKPPITSAISSLKDNESSVSQTFTAQNETI
jgi:hypothetical protein